MWQQIQEIVPDYDRVRLCKDPEQQGVIVAHAVSAYKKIASLLDSQEASGGRLCLSPGSRVPMGPVSMQLRQRH